MVDSWSVVLVRSFQEIWMQVADVIPRVIVAVVIFIFGWLIGSIIGGVVSQAIKTLKIDSVLESLGLGELAEKAGYKLNSGVVLGGLIKWFFVIVFLVASVDILGLSEVNVFLREVVLGYLPNVIVSVFILLLAALVADVTQRIMVGSARAAGFASPHLLGGIARWAIWMFAILVVLAQLGIAEPFVQTLFTGIVAMLAIAGGISFGLGGKEAAGRFIDKLKEDITGK